MRSCRHISPRSSAAALAALLAWGLGSACSIPPQIVDYAPERGSQSVPTNQPVRITFDRPMDEGSVAARFRLQPSAPGTITWPTPRQLVFTHATLKTAAHYEVVLEGGYRDAAGTINDLRHHWPFQTEAAPALTGATPSPGDSGVDPAAYLTLAFSRPMDLGSLASAISITPGIGISIRQDPTDGRRIIVAPRSLLEPNQDYTVAVTRAARDADGNQLGSGRAVSFRTGAARPLQHWLTFVATTPDPTVTGGVWIVDENGFPRLLYAGAAGGFSWSTDGSRLLVQGEDGGWVDWGLGADPIPLRLSATWAAHLAAGLGIAYVDGGALSQRLESGESVLLAQGVEAAAVSPNGRTVAYLGRAAGGWELDAVDVPLRAQYRLQSSTQSLSALAWAPDGSALSYLAGGGGKLELHVRGLRAAGGDSVVAAGLLGAPAWQDARHLLFTATVPVAGGSQTLIFKRAVTDNGAVSLDPGAGLPAGFPTAVNRPRASPDGRQIAFLAAGDSGGEQVWLMNADGTGLTQLTRYDASGFPYSCSALAWTRA